MRTASPDEAARAFVSVASNIDPTVNVPRALSLLGQRVRLLGVSTLRRTPPIGPPGQPAFINGVLALDTVVPPRRLQYDVLRRIEDDLGRVRTDDPYAPRPIDLDLLLYGRITCSDADLRLPSPDVRRPFVRAGLLEVDPMLRLPPSGKSLSSTHTDAGPSVGEPLPNLTAAVRKSLGL
ncbi:MAG: 2-amino-4-hydroxy-6-hydroxymethyldihydropteridine diphosphokinase [Planctomycetota bacterium]